jgi:hypothetical protein
MTIAYINVGRIAESYRTGGPDKSSWGAFTISLGRLFESNRANRINRPVRCKIRPDLTIKLRLRPYALSGITLTLPTPSSITRANPAVHP